MSHLLKFRIIELTEPFKVNGVDVVVGKNEVEVPDPPTYGDTDNFWTASYKGFIGTITDIELFKIEPQP